MNGLYSLLRKYPGVVYLLALATIVGVRVVGLGYYPAIEADEGGWPLSVRYWVETGVKSGDYYMAPGYHWLLGIPFRLFGAYHWVARPVSAVVALAGLWLFHRLAMRLADRPTANWAVLLLGTSYPAVLIDRRAFMEPFQLLIMIGLCLAVSAPRLTRWRYSSIALLTAMLLLTKASGAFLLPAIVLASLALWWRQRRQNTAGAGNPVALITALAVGTLAAATVFWFLYRSDPVTFLEQWTRDMGRANVPGVTRSSRFVLHPLSVDRTIRWYGDYEPLLFGLAIAGMIKAVWERRHLILAAWLGCGMSFLFMQVYIQENHRVILLPPACFLAAALLCDLHQLSPKPSTGWPSWAHASLLLLVLYSVGRLGGGIAMARNPDFEAVRWLASHSDAKSSVMAAPYVLMRLPARPLSFWSLDQPYLPTAEAVSRAGADWLLVEPREWEQHNLESGGNPAQLQRALSDCCELAFSSPGASVWRVRNATGKKASSSAATAARR